MVGPREVQLTTSALLRCLLADATERGKASTAAGSGLGGPNDAAQPVRSRVEHPADATVVHGVAVTDDHAQDRPAVEVDGRTACPPTCAAAAPSRTAASNASGVGSTARAGTAVAPATPVATSARVRMHLPTCSSWS